MSSKQTSENTTEHLLIDYEENQPADSLTKIHVGLFGATVEPGLQIHPTQSPLADQSTRLNEPSIEPEVSTILSEAKPDEIHEHTEFITVFPVFSGYLSQNESSNVDMFLDEIDMTPNPTIYLEVSIAAESGPIASDHINGATDDTIDGDEEDTREDLEREKFMESFVECASSAGCIGGQIGDSVTGAGDKVTTIKTPVVMGTETKTETATEIETRIETKVETTTEATITAMISNKQHMNSGVNNSPESPVQNLLNKSIETDLVNADPTFVVLPNSPGSHKIQATVTTSQSEHNNTKITKSETETLNANVAQPNLSKNTKYQANLTPKQVWFWTRPLRKYMEKPWKWPG